MVSAIIWDVDPILIHIGYGGLSWYGLMWAVGIYATWLMNHLMYEHENCPEEWSFQFFIWIVCGAVIGSRLGHCLFYGWQETGDPIEFLGITFNYRNPYIENPLRILEIWKGGMSSHGSAIGMMIATWLLNKYRFSRYPQFQTSWLWILDRLCVGLCVAGALIRFGNLMNSEIYGKPTDLPWGFIFVRGAVNPDIPCHPTQIYEMLYCFVALAITLYMYCKTDARRRAGLLSGVFGVIVFGVRFLLEFIKNDQISVETGHILNIGQILSIPLVALGIYLIVRAYKRPLLPIVEERPKKIEKHDRL
jgi:prolipoprotein diacylglyceryl transferase